MAVYVCKLPGGPEKRFEAENPSAAAWAFVYQFNPHRGRVSLIVWPEAPSRQTFALSIDPVDDTPMGGRAAVFLPSAP